MVLWSNPSQEDRGGGGVAEGEGLHREGLREDALKHWLAGLLVTSHCLQLDPIGGPRAQAADLVLLQDR